ncbi:MAG TPA: porin family protein [Paludibacteraceae bacterium]|nr:porin family protein [Paludibacteraceae bacterium]HQC04473.1 porin family protein [Paludibacteraceae bacterium]
MKRIFWIVSFCLTVFAASAQNLPMADYKRFHFGFTLGTSIFDFGIKPSLMEIEGKVYKADVTRLMPGFTVGAIADLRMGEYFNLRFVPSLYLADRTISYSNNVDDEIISTSIKSTSITIPLYVKYSSVRINNYRPYILAGGGIAFDLARDKQMPVLLKPGDYFVEFGAGCTIYFSFFRFSPEIRFALGFNNILTPLEERENYLDPENYKYTQALSKLTSRMFTIAFNFE